METASLSSPWMLSFCSLYPVPAVIAPSAFLQLIYYFPQFAFDLLSQMSQIWVIDGLHRCYRVHSSDFNISVRGFLNNYVARQHYTDFIFSLESLVGKGRVARAEASKTRWTVLFCGVHTFFRSRPHSPSLDQIDRSRSADQRGEYQSNCLRVTRNSGTLITQKIPE